MTNEEFRQLCLLKKHFLDKNISLPMTGEKCASIPVYSNTTKDIFSLAVTIQNHPYSKMKLG